VRERAGVRAIRYLAGLVRIGNSLINLITLTLSLSLAGEGVTRVAPSIRREVDLEQGRWVR
jgi:hypothetical protein